MKLFFKNIEHRLGILLSGIIFFLLSFAVAFAQNGTTNPEQGSLGLMNPLNAGTIPELLSTIVQIILLFAVPIVVLFIMFAGFKYVTARGDTAKLAEAKSALTWAIIGGVVVLGAEIIAQLIDATINDL